jgi:hypothetical protein
MLAVSAPVRPDSWDFPLLVHVLGAMLLVGTLALTVTALVLAWRNDDPALARLGYRSLLLGVLPAWIVMRAAAEWIASKEDLTDSNLSWIGIGSTTADGGFALILISLILAGIAVRRSRRSEGAGRGFRRATTVGVSVLLIAYLVAIWAMTTKPV